MDRQVISPKRVTSPTCGPSPPCKPTYLGQVLSQAVLIKSFNTTWLSIASLISLVLSRPVSALIVSMYVVLGLPRFGWPCWGSQSSTFEAVSSLWRAEWPSDLNLHARIVSLILRRLPCSSSLFIFCCQCTFRAVHSFLVTLKSCSESLIHEPRYLEYSTVLITSSCRVLSPGSTWWLNNMYLSSLHLAEDQSGSMLLQRF